MNLEYAEIAAKGKSFEWSQLGYDAAYATALARLGWEQARPEARAWWVREVEAAGADYRAVLRQLLMELEIQGVSIDQFYSALSRVWSAAQPA